MIHDSYGTHACDTDVLGQALRESFVEQYEGDVLEEFRSRLVDSLSDPGLRERVPEVPLKGTLDPKEVLESAFFFA